MTRNSTTTQRSITAMTLGDVAPPSFAPASVAAMGLAITAVVGRATTFLIAGPTPLGQLITLLLVATSAVLFARQASRQGHVGPLEGKLLKVATRIGVIQVVLSLWLIAAAGWIV